MTKDLEELILCQSEGASEGLSRLYERLLKHLPGRHSSDQGLLERIAKEYRKRSMAVPLDEDIPSALLRPADLPLAGRVQILSDLCNFCLESPANIDAILAFDRGAEWRLEPVGIDSAGCKYWLFSDGRLFREREAVGKRRKDSKESKEPEWELICFDYDTYRVFFEEGPLCKGKPKDRALLRLLRDEIYPAEIAPAIEELTRRRRRQHAAQILPRKRSGRIQQMEEQRRKETLQSKPEPLISPTKQLSREDRMALRRQKVEQMAESRIINELMDQIVNVEDESDVLPKSPVRVVLRIGAETMTEYPHEKIKDLSTEEPYFNLENINAHNDDEAMVSAAEPLNESFLERDTDGLCTYESVINVHADKLQEALRESSSGNSSFDLFLIDN